MPVPEALAAGAPAGGGWLVASIAWPVIALLLVSAGLMLWLGMRAASGW